MEIILISPDFSAIYSARGYEDNLQDAIESLWSSLWQQGYDPDGRILRNYGDWIVYTKAIDGTLVPQGRLQDSQYIPADCRLQRQS